MSTKVVILGLLKEKPLYGYELKRIIENHMGDWTSIAFGSIYFALNKLNEEGLVEIESEQRVGNRPSRSIYKITEKGLDNFFSLLRDMWSNYDREYYPLDIAIFFSGELPPGDVKDYIKKRISVIENIIGYLAEHKKSQLSRSGVPKFARAVFSHSEYHINAELEWLKSVLEDFEN